MTLMIAKIQLLKGITGEHCKKTLQKDINFKRLYKKEKGRKNCQANQRGKETRRKKTEIHKILH